MSQPSLDMITNLYPSLSRAERKVADYILDNAAIVLRMSVRELKDAIGVSEPTIIRFCQSLSYSGFRDFKISIAQQLSSYKSYFMSDDKSETKLQTVVRRMLENEVKIIETTLRLMDYEQLEHTAKRMIDSHRICLFGAGTSVEICHDLCRKLLRLGLSVWSFSDFHDATTLLGTFTQEDLVIVITHSGITQETGDIARIAHGRHAYTVLMTAYPNTRFKKYADTLLRTYAHESLDSRISVASRVGQYAMSDALYATIVSLMGEEILPVMEQATRDVIGR